MTITDGKTKNLSAVFWNNSQFESLSKGADIVYTINESSFKGKKEIKLNILHIIEKLNTDAVKKKVENNSVEIVDLREKCNFKSYIPRENELIFLEGINNTINAKTFNRYELVSAESLALVSVPPNLEVFKYLIKAVEPERLVLIFDDTVESTEGIIKKALGIIKHVINRKQGKTSYTELASLLGITFEAVDLMLRFFSFSGLIAFEEYYDDLIVDKGRGEKLPEAEKYKKAAAKVIQEINLFKNFIKSLGAEKIMQAIL